MILRDYQIEACVKALAAWKEHDSLMEVLPTGMGKTEIFVRLASDWDQGRVLVVAPQIELVSQAAKKIAQRTGVAPGIEQGINRSNESEWGRSPFIVGSKQSLTSKERYRRLRDVGLVIVDECHLAATKLYEEMLSYYQDQGAKVLGVTATPKRHDKRAMGNLFEDCPFEMYICDAIPQGWLVPPKSHCVQIESMDLSQVATTKSDFKDSELAKILEQEAVVFEIADVTARESGSLKTAVFCHSVNEARAVAHLLVDRYKLKADFICSDKTLCTDERRQEVLTSFTEDPDGIQIVANVGVLTTGWDFPGLEHIVMARPTKSVALYTQIFGRGTRPLPGTVDFAGSSPLLRCDAIASSAKPHFKVTDLCDLSLEHKLVGAEDVLGGKMGLEVVERAKQLNTNTGEAKDLSAVLAKAQEEIEKEEAERKRRAQVQAEARYKRLDVDPFDAHQRGNVDMRKPSRARIPFGKHKGQPISAVPTGYLKWALREGVFRAPWLHASAVAELKVRQGGAVPTAAHS